MTNEYDESSAVASNQGGFSPNADLPESNTAREREVYRMQLAATLSELLTGNKRLRSQMPRRDTRES